MNNAHQYFSGLQANLSMAETNQTKPETDQITNLLLPFKLPRFHHKNNEFTRSDYDDNTILLI